MSGGGPRTVARRGVIASVGEGAVFEADEGASGIGVVGVGGGCVCGGPDGSGAVWCRGDDAADEAGV